METRGVGGQLVDIRELTWSLRTTPGNEARLSFPANNPGLIRIEISKSRTKAPWDIQLNRPDLVVKGGQLYRLLFDARADNPRQVNLGFAQAHPPWHGLGIYQTLDLTGEWRTHSLEFSPTADEKNARIHFDLGSSTVPIELSSLRLVSLPDEIPVEPDLIVQGYYPAARCIRRSAGVRNQTPRFSVIIPTFQRRDLVVNAVRALAGQDYDCDFEVIVAVDGSRDGTAESLRTLSLPFSLTVLEQPNRGAATARNLGASAARGAILLFLDDDMEAHPRLLTEHDLSHSEGADVVIGHFPLHHSSPRGFLRDANKAWVEERARRLSQPDVELEFRDLLSGQISVKRELFDRAGGFDSDFNPNGGYGDEDLEFGYRLLAGGAKAAFNPYALSYQNYVITPRGQLRQGREGGAAAALFAKKHPHLAESIFSPHKTGVITKPQLWQTLAALGPIGAPLLNALRFSALALVEHGIDHPRAIRFFLDVYEMEYWRGVREAA